MGNWTPIRLLSILHTIIIMFICTCPVSAQQTSPEIWIENPITKQDSATVQVGDSLRLEIWVEMHALQVQNLSFYVSYDETVMSVVNTSTDPALFYPFDYTNSYFDTLSSSFVQNKMYDLEGGSGTQMDGGVDLAPNTLSGKGMIAAFTIVASQAAVNTAITIDSDPGNHRDTRLLIQGDSSSTRFEAGRMHPFTMTIEGPSAITESGLDELVRGYSLHQNYPNPFNPSTTISYSLASALHITIAVYDINGNRVKTLLNTNMPGGTHRVTWDGTNNSGDRVASGIYLYQLQTGNYTHTRKMLLLK